MKTLLKYSFILALTLCVLYSALWFGLASLTNQEITRISTTGDVTFSPPLGHVSGFPFWHHLTYTGTLSTPDFSLTVEEMEMEIQIYTDRAKAHVTLPNGFQITDRYTHKTHHFGDSHLKLASPYPLPKNHSRKAMKIWRAQKGRLLVSSLLLQKEGVKIEGSGLLDLDENLQPQGKLNLSIYGYKALMAELGRTGKLSSQEAQLATAFIGQLFGQDGPKTQKAFKTPLTIKNNALYIGPLRVTKLKRIEWE